MMGRHSKLISSLLSILVVIGGCTSTGDNRSHSANLNSQMFGKKKNQTATREVRLSREEFASNVLWPVMSTMMATSSYRFAKKVWPNSTANLDPFIENMKRGNTGFVVQKAPKFSPVADDLIVEFDDLVPVCTTTERCVPQRLLLHFRQIEKEAIQASMRLDQATRYCMQSEGNSKQHMASELIVGGMFALFPQRQYYPSATARSGNVCITLPVAMHFNAQCDNCNLVLKDPALIPHITVAPVFPKK